MNTIIIQQDSTEHMGFEWEARFKLNSQLSMTANGALVMNYFNDGKKLTQYSCNFV